MSNISELVLKTDSCHPIESDLCKKEDELGGLICTSLF